MTTLASLVDRVEVYLQDQHHEGWTRTQMETQVYEEIQRLARQELFGALIWTQVIAGQAQYALPDTTVGIEGILYGGHPLRRVEETSLARLARQWETRHATPAYYTLTLQPSQVVRIVPQPLHGGQAAVGAGVSQAGVAVGVARPDMPIGLGGLGVTREDRLGGALQPTSTPLPFEATLEHNLALFTWEAPSRQAADVGLLAVFDDIVVFHAVGELCGQATPYHDLEKSVVFKQLGRMLLDIVLG
jgi:hypothetical protein